MERSLIGTSACIVWEGFLLGWAQELGESQHSSWLSQSFFVLPGSWCGLLSLHLTAFLFSQPLVPEQLLFLPLDTTGQNRAPSGFADCFTTSCHLSWLQLWHWHQPCCFHQSTLAPTGTTLRKPCTVSTTVTTEYKPIHSFSTWACRTYDFFPLKNVFWPLDHDKRLPRDGTGFVCQMRAEVRSKLWPDRTFITFSFQQGTMLFKIDHDTSTRLKFSPTAPFPNAKHCSNIGWWSLYPIHSGCVEVEKHIAAWAGKTGDIGVR